MKTIVSFFSFVIAMMFMTMYATAQDPPPANAGDQVSQVIEATGTTVSGVVTTVFDKTTEAVKSLAEALKVPAEHVYTVLTRQQVVKALSWMSISVIWLLIGVMLMLLANKEYGVANDKHLKKNPTYSPLIFFDEDYKWAWQWWIGLICAVMGVAIVIISANVIFTGMFNPEYGAIKEIMELL